MQVPSYYGLAVFSKEKSALCPSMPKARWLVVLFPGWRVFAFHGAAFIGAVSRFRFIESIVVLINALFDPGKTPPASAPRTPCQRRLRWVDRSDLIE
jgi:hypothetical protein